MFISVKKSVYFLALAVFLTACGGAPKTSEEAGDVKQASVESQMYVVDLENSVINWEGAKITQTVHHGIVKLSEGNFHIKDGELEAANFVIDMSSIEDHDLTEETGKYKLEGHLKSADFFQVEDYPVARLEITDVQQADEDSDATHIIKGNLTIKDITNGITFPAMVTMAENILEAAARFEINRNEWGVIWGGTKTDQSIKDMLQNNLIKDLIVFEVNLIAHSE
jgi:polyisoprenoid-binding protein YceI